MFLWHYFNYTSRNDNEVGIWMGCYYVNVLLESLCQSVQVLLKSDIVPSLCESFADTVPSTWPTSADIVPSSRPTSPDIVPSSRLASPDVASSRQGSCEQSLCSIILARFWWHCDCPPTLTRFCDISLPDQLLLIVTVTLSHFDCPGQVLRTLSHHPDQVLLRLSFFHCLDLVLNLMTSRSHCPDPNSAFVMTSVYHNQCDWVDWPFMIHSHSLRFSGFLLKMK